MKCFEVRIRAGVLLCILSGAVAGLGLPGCRIAPVPGKVGQSAQKEAKVVARGFALQKYIRVTSLTAGRVTGELLEVRLGLENIRFSKDMWCDIQVVFYEEDGFEAERTNWQPLRLAANEIIFFKTTSLSSSVSDFSVLLRNPRRDITD